MTKNEFFKYLDKRLSVLNEKEREDIKSEYSQHIDMKIQSGKSEEEAINDFGDIESFVDDILSAYNVDPNYRKSHIDSNIAEKAINNGVGIFRKAFNKTKEFVNESADFILSNKLSTLFSLFFKGLIIFVIIFFVYGIGYVIVNRMGMIFLRDMFPNILGIPVGKYLWIIIRFIYAVTGFCVAVTLVIAYIRDSICRINKKGGIKVESNIVESKDVVNEKANITEENNTVIDGDEEKDNVKTEEIKSEKVKRKHKSLADYDFMGFLFKIVMLCIRISVFFTLLPYAFMLFFAVVGFGILLVAAFVGYPALGLAICTLGFDLCAVAVFAFIVKLVYFTKFGKKEENGYEA